MVSPATGHAAAAASSTSSASTAAAGAVPAAASSAAVRQALSQWDELAPLSERQKDAVLDLSMVAGWVPMPQLPLASATPATPAASSGSSVGSTAAAAAGGGGGASLALASSEHSAALAAANSSAPDGPIETAQQFFGWFASVEMRMEGEQEESYRSYIDLLSRHRARCDEILANIDSALDALNGMHEQYTSVSTKTTALHDACQLLLRDQNHLVRVLENIGTKLAYFSEVEACSRFLNDPVVTVNSDRFIPTLTRIDECIAFISQHRHFKDAEVYLTRFRQNQSRALTLIKLHIVSALKTATQQCEIKKELNARSTASTLNQAQAASGVNAGSVSGAAGTANSSSTEALFALHYTKFRTYAPRIKALAVEIESRCKEDGSPYQSLLQDCLNCYFGQRHALLDHTVHEAISRMQAESGSDMAQLLRHASAYLIRICQNEIKLYHHFFSIETPGLESLQDQLSGILYDAIRPSIIQQNNVEQLMELCEIVSAEILADPTVPALAFEAVALQILEDLQQRLVFRVQAYVRSDIQLWQPTADDLAYPEKFLNAVSPQPLPAQSPTELASGQSTPATAATPRHPSNQFTLWFPTLQRSLVLLSRLYRCIDKRIFEGISQHTVSVCIQSLVAASNAIAAKKGPLDGELFLIKHLLVLREQLSPFDVEFAVLEKSLDLRKLKDAAFSLLSRGGTLFSLNRNNAVLNFLLNEAPRMSQESFVDSKKELDVELKQVCERFVLDVTKSIIAPLTTFLTKSAAFLKVKTDAGPSTAALSLRRQPFAYPEKIKQIVNETYMLLKAQLESTQRSLSLYLGNAETEYILFRPIKNNIEESYKQLYATVQGDDYSEEDRQIAAVPDINQVRLFLHPPPKAAPVFSFGSSSASSGVVASTSSTLSGTTGAVAAPPSEVASTSPPAAAAPLS